MYEVNCSVMYLHALQTYGIKSKKSEHKSDIVSDPNKV